MLGVGLHGGLGAHDTRVEVVAVRARRVALVLCVLLIGWHRGLLVEDLLSRAVKLEKEEERGLLVWGKDKISEFGILS